MANKCPVSLPSPHVPHPYAAITAAACESVTPKLNPTNKVLIHFPAAVRERRRWDSELPGDSVEQAIATDPRAR